ncbi:hypothetical protein N7E81_02390 [Reichenbachiella carrageenanivorans]|uniref:AlwI restriction endonuclease n=1 Tax=Reichenbachiella carrageenanivorans TaxID=2979869 RepID=A0ABY6D2H9_9BACT|nr:hypothetical protein [Reichenbachiella carrageenanivorans]UXX79954.1 hypothetical protein N7E81_02390 [Reichenbachiella carrageenanivorans]
MSRDSIDFKYIRNRVREYPKDEMLGFCLNLLEQKKNDIFPVWFVFALMKWTIIYGGEKYPNKKLTPEKFSRLFNKVQDFNTEHISGFLKSKQVHKAFQILYNQQFYLQKTVHKEIFATQLKLFISIKGKYDIDNSFKQKTGLSIYDFLFIEQIIFFYINIEELGDKQLYFDGKFEDHFLQLVAEITTVDKVKSFLNLLTLNPLNAEKSVSGFKHKIRNEDLQTMEMSFFTMFPFMLYQGEIRLVDKSVFYHTINYYIYDFLKANDEKFTTEFGDRLERYVELGLREMQVSFKTESEIKKILQPKSKLVDFYVEEENVLIECKATELQAYPFVNPTDELLYNSLKSSVLKAYFKQILSVANQLLDSKEKWGIIITYKELFWSHFKELHKLSKENYSEKGEDSSVPPENVFIIDLHTWDRIVEIVKNGMATLSDILESAKEDNSDPNSSKMLFKMHLDQYKLEKLNLSFLRKEVDAFDIKNTTHNK